MSDLKDDLAGLKGDKHSILEQLRRMIEDEKMARGVSRSSENMRRLTDAGW